MKGNKDFYSRLKQYVIIAFLLSATIFISYFIFSNSGNILKYVWWFLKKLASALIPLAAGVVLAYIFNRPVMFFERFMRKLKMRRTLSIALLYLLIAGAIALIINYIVPLIQQNILGLINDLPRYSSVINSNIQNSIDWLKNVEWFKNKGTTVNNNNLETYIARFSTISSLILDAVMAFAKGLTQGIFNFFLAMIVAFYILKNKEDILNSMHQIVYLYGGKRINNAFAREVREINSIVGGYITGVIIDCFIIGALASIGLLIIGHKYYILMGITMGISNLIPYFGAIIAVIIASLLGLFQGVPMALYTLLLLIIMNQIDGNIIQPKIVGDKVGLGPLSVIGAVIVFGSFAGIGGMLIAIPLTALAKAILTRIINRRRRVVAQMEMAEAEQSGEKK